MVQDERISDNYWFMRRPLQFLADVAVLCAAFFVAYLPAVNIQLGEYYVDTALRQLPFVILVQLSTLFLVGAYSIIWRYVSIEDIKVFIKAAVISGVILIAFRFLLIFTEFNWWQVPISVILIDTVMAFGGLLALRITRRFVYELDEKNRTYTGRKRLKQKPTLLVGAGRMGATLAKEMIGRADAELEIRGFVDDDPRKRGGSVSGIKVLGTTHDLPRLVDELNIKQVVLAIDQAQGKEIRRIMDVCSAIPVKAQIVPSLNEIAHGRISVSRIRDVQIEDLLGRDPVELDDENLHEFLSGKTVMVTGAGGSIGSELVRQITVYAPEQILLVERAEFFLFQIGRELASAFPETNVVPLIADIGDEPRMREIFSQYRPNVIFHAAAHKHVPLMEVNSSEAIKNNVFATRRLGELAGEFGAADFVMISTDKAVNPTSIMGASKRIAEIVLQDLSALQLSDVAVADRAVDTAVAGAYADLEVCESGVHGAPCVVAARKRAVRRTVTQRAGHRLRDRVARAQGVQANAAPVGSGLQARFDLVARQLGGQPPHDVEVHALCEDIAKANRQRGGRDQPDGARAAPRLLNTSIH